MLEGIAAVEARLREIRALVGEIDPAQNSPLSSAGSRSKEEFETLLTSRYHGRTEPAPRAGSIVSASDLSAPGVLNRSLPPRADGPVAPFTLPLASRVRYDIPADAIPVDPDESARRARYLPAIREAAQQSGLPEALIGAVIQAESSFRPETVSNAGAQGLMQLMPDNVRELGVTDAFDPRQNVLAGARHLRAMVDRFGSLEKSLAAYNAGPGRVERYGGIPPYRETQNYVRRITTMLQQAGALRDAPG